jgi:putative DNA primase/helicase
MPNPNLPFDDWLRILYATKGALKEEGRSAFMRWSAKSIKHDQAFADREWQKARPTVLGAGSLIWMAKKLGWQPVTALQVAQPQAAGKGVVVDEDGEIASLVWPHMSGGKTPKPLNTLENFAALSRFLGVQYRMNMMTGEEIVHIPGMNVAEGCEANSAVTTMMSQAHLMSLPSSLVPEFMSMLCAQNPFHPAKQWIDSKPWDGVSRLETWLATITAKDEPLKKQMMRRWALSAIAALEKPGGVSAHGVLTLLGDQGIGKTSWFLSLVPKGLGFAKDGMILRPDSPDSVRQVTSNWLVELGELDATFRKSDIAALKAFITQASDTYRLPYARKNTVNPRRTVFFASVNDSKFLADNTGNRRYWTIDCTAINYRHQIDMQQFWAEVKTLYQAGESWFLDDAELASLNESNEQFMTLDPIAERLETRLDWDAPSIDWKWRTATEIALAIGLSNPSRSDVTRVATYLHKTRGCTARRTNGISKTLVPQAVFA